MQCYTKFGDVVYMLTRFFRDAGAGSPTKLKVTRVEDHGESPYIYIYIYAFSDACFNFPFFFSNCFAY